MCNIFHKVILQCSYLMWCPIWCPNNEIQKFQYLDKLVKMPWHIDFYNEYCAPHFTRNLLILLKDMNSNPLKMKKVNFHEHPELFFVEVPCLINWIKLSPFIFILSGRPFWHRKSYFSLSVLNSQDSYYLLNIWIIISSF